MLGLEPYTRGKVDKRLTLYAAKTFVFLLPPDINFMQIDPNTIDKLEVFKGEKAIMRYGERAKNGAIVITLKKK